MGSNLRSLPIHEISAAHALEGKTLDSGWHVTRKLPKKRGDFSGGQFSVCYLVEKNGEQGFLKVVDIYNMITSNEDVLRATSVALNMYNFEKDILVRCANNNLTRVSKLLIASFQNFPDFFVPNVYYMVFEKADGDVRAHVKFAGIVEDAWKLRSLHNIATGVKQLHGIDVSHQDLKPSNVLIFDKNISKIGDLGRALCESISAPHFGSDFPGDEHYAPPEYFNQFVLPNWRDKVFAIDCYLLGSMACFYFTGQSMTALLFRKMDNFINIRSLSFENALAYWIKAFDEAIIVIEDHTNNIVGQDKLIEAIQMLCFPDPRKRGHLKNIQGRGNNYHLERFVEVFNLLARKAEYKIAN